MPLAYSGCRAPRFFDMSPLPGMLFRARALRHMLDMMPRRYDMMSLFRYACVATPRRRRYSMRAVQLPLRHGAPPLMLPYER